MSPWAEPHMWPGAANEARGMGRRPRPADHAAATAPVEQVRRRRTLFGMAEQPAEEAHRTGRSVRLDTLVRLRWLAVIGQTTAVLVVYFGLDFELPIWACLAVIALAAWLNVALRVRFRVTQRIEPDRAAWLFAFDIAEIAILGGFAALCATVLAFYSYPLPWDPDETLRLPSIYVMGVWIATLLAIGF